MREIKFRAWDKIDKKIREVEAIGFSNQFVLLYGEADEHNVARSITRKFDDIELIEFVGLKDKNGKEIYEGDLLKTNFKQVNQDIELNQAIVEVKEKSILGFSLYSTKGLIFQHKKDGWIKKEKQFTPFSVKYYNMEIIGNIYENPELLKEGQKTCRNQTK